MYSEKQGQDVGVPETIREMLRTSELDNIAEYSEASSSVGDIGMIARRVPQEKLDDFYQLMVEGYLLGTDFVSPLWVMKPDGKYTPSDLVQTGIVQDEHGKNQLEGELRRYCARVTEIQQLDSIAHIALTPSILEDYCRSNQLNKEVLSGLAKKLDFR